MNERIKQCWLTAARQDRFDWDTQTEFIERFAKLVVRECASLCYNSKLLDGEAHAQNLLYEFNVDECRSDK